MMSRCLVSSICLVLGCFALPGVDLLAQDTTAQMEIHVPEQGEVYINYGSPPRVRIYPGHRPPPVQPRMVTPAAPEPPRAAAPALTRDRVDRFISGAGDRRIQFQMTDRGPVLIRFQDDDRIAPDTLFLTEDLEVPTDIDTPIVAMRDDPRIRIPEQLGPATVPIIETEIVERILLDEGLFRSVSVQFEFDRTRLLATSDPTLDAIADIMQRYPDMVIEVGGHTDNVGNPAYNQRLSEQRAAAVRDDLIDRGVEPGRLRARGYGEREPILPNRNQTTRALNRRVDFRIIGETPTREPVPEPTIGDEELLQELQDALREALRESLRRE